VHPEHSPVFDAVSFIALKVFVLIVPFSPQISNLARRKELVRSP
jgi:hypothetical protein